MSEKSEEAEKPVASPTTANVSFGINTTWVLNTLVVAVLTGFVGLIFTMYTSDIRQSGDIEELKEDFRNLDRKIDQLHMN